MKKKNIVITVLASYSAFILFGLIIAFVLTGADSGSNNQIATTNLRAFTANGTGEIATTVSLSVDAEIVGVFLSLEEVGGSGNLTMNTDSATSTTYDFTHDTQDMTSVQWYEWPSDAGRVIRVQDADIFNIIYASPVTTNSWGLKVWWKEI